MSLVAETVPETADLSQWLGRVHCGDALAFLRGLPDCSVDSVITDPPYCSGGYLEAQKNTKAQGLRGSTVRDADFTWFAADNMGTAGLVWLLRSVALEARRLLLPNRSMLMFCDWRMVPNLIPPIESSGLRWRNMVVWQKPNPALGNGFRPAHELILEFTNGATVYNRKDGTNCIPCSRVAPSVRDHSAQKPAALLEELITVTTSEGGVLLDPFAGSGTTCVAAVRTGRQFIGVELDEKYCDIANHRIAEARRQTRMDLGL